MVDPLHVPANFLFKTWRSLGLPDPTALQYDFMTYLNDHIAWGQLQDEASKEGYVNEGARKILMAFRGAAKTYVCTTNAVYRLRENPLEECLVVSATDAYAGAITTMAYQMVTKFDWLAPDMAPTSDQRSSALSFDVRGARAASKDTSFAARGIFGQITGLRSTLIIGDDLETPNTSETEVKRSQLRTRMGELPGAIIKPGGDILLLGTAQNEQTVYKEYAEEKGFELSMYPITYPIPSEDPRKDERTKYGTRLAPLLAKALQDNPLLAGTSTEPTRFDERDILRRKQAWGTTEFQRQFQLWMDAGAENLYPLRMRDIGVMEISPPLPTKKVMLPAEVFRSTMHDQRARGLQLDTRPGDASVFYPLKIDIMQPAEEVLCWIDPSGEGKDETTWSILAGLGGRVFLLHQGADMAGTTEPVLQRIAADCKKWGVQTIKIESNFGQGMMTNLLRPYLTAVDCMASLEDFRIGKQRKELRMVSTLEPIITSHRLWVNRSVWELDFHSVSEYKTVEEAKRRFYRLSYQLTRLTKNKGCLVHDDRADGLAGGVAHFAERLQEALDKTAAKGREAALEEELEKVIAARRKMGLTIIGEHASNRPASFGRSIGHDTRPHLGHNGGPPLDQ